MKIQGFDCTTKQAKIIVSANRRNLDCASQAPLHPGYAGSTHPVMVSSPGPGNCLNLILRSEQVTEVFTGFGRRGVRTEQVATEATEPVRRYLAAGVPVGEHLADQLLLPLALAGGGEFLTLRPSRHTLTNQAVIQQCLPVTFEIAPLSEDRWRIRVGAC